MYDVCVCIQVRMYECISRRLFNRHTCVHVCRVNSSKYVRISVYGCVWSDVQSCMCEYGWTLVRSFNT